MQDNYSLVLQEEEILNEVLHEMTGRRFSRSAKISQKAKDKNYVMSKFTYVTDYELWKFCQNIPSKGQLSFGGEMYSPFDEDY